MNKTKSLILFFSALTISGTMLVSGCAPKGDQVKKSQAQKVSDAEIRVAEERRLQKEKQERDDEKRKIADQEERLREERLQAESDVRRRLEEERLEEERLRMQAAAEPQAYRTPGTEVSELKDIRFSYDQADLGTKAMEILQKNAVWLQDNSRVKIQIEGHCDERGTSEYNLALAERRALSAKKYLMSLGVAAERIYTISYGEEMPLDSGNNEAAWAKNRRAHFLITSN